MKPGTVLISGASGGIGAATARAFADLGWQVLAGTRFPEKIPASGTIRPIRLDPASAQDRQALVELLARDFAGRLDVLVNNAGYAQSGALELLSEADWHHQMAVNLIAPALLTAALLPALRAAQGCIINVSSILGRTGFAWQGAYCASKFGLEGWSESLLLETQGQGVRVHLVEPGSTRSNFGRQMRMVDASASPYRVLAEKFAATRARLAQRAQAPERVAALIVRTATRPPAPFRQTIGRDARLTALLLRLLPAPAYLALSKALARRLFGLRAR